MSGTQSKPLTSAEIADLVAKAKAAMPREWVAKALGNSISNPLTILRFAATVAELEGKVEKLRRALAYYGSHDRGCPGNPYCTCGYEEASAGEFE